MIPITSANTSAAPPHADIDRSPTILLSSLFAAHRSGDALLERFYLRRLHRLGITITFAAVPGAKASATGVEVQS